MTQNAHAAPAIGTRQMSYEMQPCAANGQPFNGGMNYANADTIDDARAYATRAFASPNVRSVKITGREMEFRGYAWAPVKGGAHESETVRNPAPAPLTAADRRLSCYPTTILDYFEIVHERRSDGSCKCGKYSAQS